jgi:hypothetical protein
MQRMDASVEVREDVAVGAVVASSRFDSIRRRSGLHIHTAYNIRLCTLTLHVGRTVISYINIVRRKISRSIVSFPSFPFVLWPQDPIRRGASVRPCSR